MIDNHISLVVATNNHAILDWFRLQIKRGRVDHRYFKICYYDKYPKNDSTVIFDNHGNYKHGEFPKADYYTGNVYDNILNCLCGLDEFLIKERR